MSFEFKNLDTPPDPDQMNNSRAEWALSALREFKRIVSGDDEDLIADFLTDLMHLCDRLGDEHPKFEDQLTRARENYDAETFNPTL